LRTQQALDLFLVAQITLCFRFGVTLTNPSQDIRGCNKLRSLRFGVPKGNRRSGSVMFCHYEEDAINGVFLIMALTLVRTHQIGLSNLKRDVY